MQEIFSQGSLDVGDKFAQDWRGLGGSDGRFRMNGRSDGRLGDGSGQEAVAERGLEIGNEFC